MSLRCRSPPLQRVPRLSKVHDVVGVSPPEPRVNNDSAIVGVQEQNTRRGRWVAALILRIGMLSKVRGSDRYFATAKARRRTRPPEECRRRTRYVGSSAPGGYVEKKQQCHWGAGGKCEAEKVSD